MFHKDLPDLGIFSKSLQYRGDFISFGRKTVHPGVRICTGQIVLCMVAGYDHERRQHDLFRMKAVGSPEKGVQGRIGFYSSKKNIFMSGIFKTVIQSSINRVCVVLCSMSHQYKCSVRIHVPEFICNYPDDRLVIFFCCEKRISENNTGKTVTKRKRIGFHLIIFDTVDHMSRLYDHIGDTIQKHLFQSFLYRVDRKTVPLFQFGNDHFACPCTVGGTGRECIGNIVLDGFDGKLTGVFIACAETYY